MNRFITISGIALLLPLASCAARDIEPTIIGDTLEFTLRDFDGNEVRHTDVRFKGKVVLVDIWGTWCPPCRDAVPNLVDMQEKYSDAGPVIVGVAFEDSEDPEERRERVMKFVDEYRVNYLMLDGTQAGSVSEAFPQ